MPVKNEGVIMAKLLAGLIASICFAAVAHAQQNQINVNGTGVVQAEPDTALFTFGIAGQTDTPAVAMERADAVGGDLVRRLERIGIEARDIRSTPVTLSPFMDRQSQRQLIRYARTTRATLRDLEEIDEVYSAALEAGVNSIAELTFSVSNYRELEDRARDLALEDARMQAEAIAATLGIEVGRVLSVNVSRSSPVVGRADMRIAMAAEAAAAPDFRSGEIEITATANVAFEIIHR
jgi:uncharacterized protein YggE